MRIFLWIVLFAVLSNADTRYAVQVLSVKEKKALTPEFMEKLKQFDIPHTVKYANREYKVLLGEFPTEEEAASRLSEIREKVSPDAFVTSVEVRDRLKADAKMQQMMVLTQAKLLHASKQEEPEKAAETGKKPAEEKAQSVEIPGPQDKLVIRKTETKIVKPMKEEGKTEEIFCKPSKKALREAEISEALLFYKNSSFYRFDQGH